MAVDNTQAALITGASSGLGLAAAMSLHQRGFQVALASRSKERLSAAADSFPKGARILTLQGDVSRPEDVDHLVSKTVDEFGGLSVLVANSGGPPAGSFHQLDDDDWSLSFHLTLMSVVRSVRAVVPVMKATGGGRIVVIGSSSIRQPIKGLTLSNAFRPAVAGLVKDLAIELARDQITVNMACPGRIDTGRVRMLDEIRAKAAGESPEDARNRSERAIPFGRYGLPEEFGAVVGFLASAEASYVTGQTVLVDGGMVSTLP